jgi:hypothetical protein
MPTSFFKLDIYTFRDAGLAWNIHLAEAATVSFEAITGLNVGPGRV